MPEVRCQKVYEGKVFTIWAAWQDDDPTNHVFGSTQQEALENFSLRLQIVFENDPITGGIRATCPKVKDLVGVGGSTKSAERSLMRQINLLSDKVDWREMFFEFVIATGVDYNTMPWAERELAIVRREMERRANAARFSMETGRVETRGTGEVGEER